MKIQKSSVALCCVIIVVGLLETTFHQAQAGPPDAKPDGYYRPYGSVDNTYDNIEEVNPHGQPFNKWLTRLFECRPEVKKRGFIRVGSPQVYSRQLVYRDRAEEIQFLSDRLKATKEFHLKYQGVMDARLYEALAAQLAVSIDPASGKVLDQSQSNLLQQTKNQADLNAVQQEISLLKLKQELAIATNTLDKINETKQPADTPPAPATDEQAQKDIAALKLKIDALESKIATLSVPVVGATANGVEPAKGAAGAATSKALTAGGSEAKIVDDSKVGITAIEEEKSILEVRRFLQNERRRLSFDDLHDSSGSITLELGMLVTLMPPANEHQYAVLEISVEKPDGKDDQSYDYVHLMDRWADYLGPAMQMESDFVSVRYDSQNAIPYTEKFMDIAHKNLVLEQLIKNSGKSPEIMTDQDRRRLMTQIVGQQSTSFMVTHSEAIIPTSSQTSINANGSITTTTTPPTLAPAPARNEVLSADFQSLAAENPRTAQTVRNFVRNKPEAQAAVGMMDRVLSQSLLKTTSKGLLTLDSLGGPPLPPLPPGTNSSGGMGPLQPAGGAAAAAQVPSNEDLLKKELFYEYLSAYYGSEFMPLYSKYAITGKLTDLERKKAFKFLNWSDKGVKVLSVDPAEQAQNISMLGATQSISNLVLSVNAMLGGGVAGSGRADSYRDNQLFMQSVNRKPVAVGFVNGSYPDPSFGWILGPRFEIAMKRRWFQLGFLGQKRPTPVFMHEPTTHQVQVVISLPTWIPKLMLKVKAHWVDERTGLPSTAIQAPCVFNDDWNINDPSRRSVSDCATRIPVYLEPDYAALTEGLLDYVHGKRRPPRIFMQYKDEKFTLTSNGNKHHLVLLGKDLWRSPTVYLDSLPATSVDVMPGLNGIVANFEGDLPDSQDKYYNVTVSTDGGFDTIKDIVGSPKQIKIIENAQAGPAAPLLSLKTKSVDMNFTDATSPLNIRFNVLNNPIPQIAPEKYLEGSIRVPGMRGTVDCSISRGQKNEVIMSMPPTDKSLQERLPDLVPQGDTPSAVKIACNLFMPYFNEATADDDKLNVLNVKGPEVILFKPNSKIFTFADVPAAADASHNLDLNLGSGSMLSVKLNFPVNMAPDLFNEAYPEYKDAISKRTLTLLLKSQDKQKEFSLLQDASDGIAFRLYSAEVAKAFGVKADNQPVLVDATLIVPGPEKTHFDMTRKISMTLPPPPPEPAKPDAGGDAK